MNFHLAREIYGRTPLLVDQPTFSTLSSLLANLRAGLIMDTTTEKANSISLYNLSNATKVIDSTYQLNKASSDDYIYVIYLNGPIIKNGGASSYGMKDLAASMALYQSDERVIGGIILTDSGGGSSLGMEVMIHAIENRVKPIVGLIERAGCACSAAAGIIFSCDHVMSESEDSEVGSLGTLVSFAGIPNKATDSDGYKHVRMYAPASTKKNDWFEEAINNDNYDVVVNEVLVPYNDKFMSHVRSSRPNVKESQLDGSVYRAGDVIGSLVDSIGSFQDAFNKVIELSASDKYNKVNNQNNNNNIQNTTAMTAQEFKAQHPAAYQEVFNAGVAAESDRIGAWMAHLETDSSAVKAGIEGGEAINQTAREKFLVKANANAHKEALKQDSPKDLVTNESINENVEQSEADKFYALVNKDLN